MRARNSARCDAVSGGIAILSWVGGCSSGTAAKAKMEPIIGRKLSGLGVTDANMAGTGAVMRVSLSISVNDALFKTVVLA